MFSSLCAIQSFYLALIMPNPGEELRKLLLKEGTLDRVETAIQRQKIEEQSDTLRGGWHTEASLQKEGWTQSPS